MKPTEPKSKRKEPPKKLNVEELESRVALSVPDQKKSPFPSPYMPGTLYGLVRRDNL